MINTCERVNTGQAVAGVSDGAGQGPGRNKKPELPCSLSTRSLHGPALLAVAAPSSLHVHGLSICPLVPGLRFILISIGSPEEAMFSQQVQEQEGHRDGDTVPDLRDLGRDGAPALPL